MNKGDVGTIGPRIRICRFVDASARCSVSNRRDQLSDSCLSTEPSTTTSTFSATSYHAARSASFERTRSGRGKPRPPRDRNRTSKTSCHSIRLVVTTPLPVLLTVVNHMATLAQGLQISQPVIGGIMVKVRGRQRHPGCSNSDVVTHLSSKAGQSPSASIAPGPFVFIPPPTIAQMLDLTAMRPAAPLAPAFSSLEPDHRRKLRPVDRIKPFVLGADRHRAFQRRDDFAPIRQTQLIRDSRQRGGGTIPRKPRRALYGLPRPPPAQMKRPPAVKPEALRSPALYRISCHET
jgi:hypothetical protein